MTSLANLRDAWRGLDLRVQLSLAFLTGLTIVALAAGLVSPGMNPLAQAALGARTSLLVVTAVLALAVPAGLVLGVVAGYWGGPADFLVSRGVEVAATWPTVVLVAVVRAAEPDPGVLSLVLVLGVVQGAQLARLTRSEVLRVRATPHLLATRALGVSPYRLLLHHVLPEVRGPLVVAATFSAGAVVGTEAALSFIGLGLPEAWPSWGAQLGVAARPTDAGALLPAALVLLTTLAFFALGDALLEPRAASRGLEGKRGSD